MPYLNLRAQPTTLPVPANTLGGTHSPPEIFFKNTFSSTLKPRTNCTTAAMNLAQHISRAHRAALPAQQPRALAAAAPSPRPLRLSPPTQLLRPHTPSRSLSARRTASAVRASSGEPFEPQICVVLGTQWGDEGKGKLVDILAQQYEVVARAQGGANAGHTIYDTAGNKYKLHLIPSGILNPEATCVVGNGVVVHLPGLFEEIRGMEARGISVEGRLLISDRAHMLFELHKEIDGRREEELAGKQIGTTKRGIGPAYSSKATRNGVRVGDLKDLDSFAAKLKKLAMDGERRFSDFEYDVEADIENYRQMAATVAPYIADTVHLINTWAANGRRILIEGANATMLDIDFGTYPFVTSSNPSIGGVITGLGIAPNRLGAIIGVAKAYTTRVGAGPYPTELFDELAEELREIGAEYGTTTGRPRRIGWLDMVALNYAATINGLTHLNLTKLDVLSDLAEIKVGVAYIGPDGNRLEAFPSDLDLLEACSVEYETLPGWKVDISGVRRWEDLPVEAQRYVQYVEDAVGVHCKWIGVGPGRDAIVLKPEGNAAA